MNTEENEYQKVKKRARKIGGFYTHLLTYVLINALLFLIDITTSPDTLWFYWPLFGWGIGVSVHAFYVFGSGHWFGPGWEEKKIKEIMD